MAAMHMFFGVFLVAAGLKFYDVPAFARAVATWSLVPEAAVPFAAVAVPTAELALACLWFLGIARQLIAIIGIVMLGGFTVLYGVHLLGGEEPDCGCLGMVKFFADARLEMALALCRNGVLLMLALFGARPWTVLNRRKAGICDCSSQFSA